jgi:serine/threonine protein kinase
MPMPPELETVLTGYLQALEAGTAEPREEWLARYPQWQAELKQFLETYSKVHSTWAVFRETPRPDQLPKTFGPYTLFCELGVGGMGVVYRARHNGHERDVALKMIRGLRIDTTSDRQRFRVEVAAAIRLLHPNITAVLDAGEIDGQPYFTMPVLDGGNLAQHRFRYAGTPLEAVRVVRELAMAVDHAHRNGILHRDLKPSNVLFDSQGKPHLTDFGLAKFIVSDEQLTRSGQIVGTPAYAAPESFANDGITTAVDIYGLGGLLYYAVTGQAPTPGKNDVESIDAARNRDAVSPRRTNKLVSRDLEAIILQCLAKDPQRRYTSALQLSEDLDRLLEGKSVSARQPSTRERMARSVRRHPMIAALFVMLAVVSSFTGWMAWKRFEDTSRLNKELLEAIDRERARNEEKLQYLYSSRIPVAADRVQTGRYEEASEILSALIPKNGEPDLREFTWHHLWRVARTRQRVQVHLRGIHAVVVSPNGKFYATAAYDDQIAIIDPESGNVIRRWSTKVFNNDLFHFRFQFSPDSTQLFTAYTDFDSSRTQLNAWDVATGSNIASNEVEMNRLGGIVPRSDGTVLIFGGSVERYSGKILEWNPSNNVLRGIRNDSNGTLMHIAPSSDDNVLYLVETKYINEVTGSSQLRQLDLTTNTLRRFQGLDSNFDTTSRNLTCSPNGQWLAASDESNRIYIWNLRTLTLAQKIRLNNSTSSAERGQAAVAY